jgi:hypothetical protein
MRSSNVVDDARMGGSHGTVNRVPDHAHFTTTRIGDVFFFPLPAPPPALLLVLRPYIFVQAVLAGRGEISNSVVSLS